MSEIIIDGHSHIGDDYRHGKSDINDYIEFCNSIGVNYGLVMPVPCPKKVNSSDPCLLWNYSDNHFNLIAEKNPYRDVNYELKNTVEKYDNQGMRLFYVPMIHPKLDDISVIDKMIDETDPVALKLHGLWGGFGINDFSEELLDYLEYKGIPLIIHTHWDSSTIAERPIRANEQAVAQNTALGYAKLFENRKIMVTLNHGVRLQKEAIKIVNNSKFIKVALGPDYVLQNAHFWVDEDKEVLRNKRYLNILKDSIKGDKIIFDIDYNYNASYPNNFLDYGSVERVRNVFSDNIENVMYKNLLEQYPKVKKKVR